MLRDYQNIWVDRVCDAQAKHGSVLGQLPTGGGKTFCFATIMQRHQGAAVAIVHRKEIVAQISMSLAVLGVHHRIVAPPDVVRRIRRKHLKKFNKSFVDPHSLVGVASVQTVTSRSAGNNALLKGWMAQCTFAVFDEGHHYVDKGLWARAIDRLPHAKKLFVTATPERADGLGLGSEADGFCDVMVEGPPVQWLIDQGYLSPFTYKAPKSDLDVSGIPVTAGGDLNSKAMRERVVSSHLVGDVVQQYHKFCPGKRALVFATDVQTSEDFAEKFRVSGVAAASLCGATENGERDKKLDLFEGDGLRVLSNVDLFDEGFDVPGVDAAIMARPTMSLAKYLQMVGRALRPVYAPGFDLSTAEGRKAAIAAGPKPYAIIIDPVNNWLRHGAPNWPRQWSLGRSVKGGGTGGGVAQRVCVECTQPYEKALLQCPFCGAPPALPEPSLRTLENVDGDLEELDSDTLRNMFEARQRANLSPDDHVAAKHVPPIGQAAERKRHAARLYRREVLQHLTGHWGEMHPAGRTEREKHKRFYLRFGVDIHTAFTLSEKDTDALIDSIKENFHADL